MVKLEELVKDGLKVVACVMVLICVQTLIVFSQTEYGVLLLTGVFENIKLNKCNTTLSYDTKEIQKEVRNTLLSYFNITELLPTTFNLCSYDIYISKVYPNSYVFVGFTNDTEVYRMVLVHEYTHIILFNLNISIEDTLVQESIADVTTRWLEHNGSVKIFGVNNEERVYPYDVITNRLIEEDKESCLKGVYNMSNKINSKEELYKRFKECCNITILETQSISSSPRILPG